MGQKQRLIRQGLKWAALTFTLFCMTQSVAGREPLENGTLIAKVRYTFPAYEQVKGIELAADKKEYEAAIENPAFVFEKLRYASDGLAVVSYLYRPRETSGRKYPLIIFARGSATMGDAAPPLIALFHRLGSQGFVILAPQYRGSDGGEGHDEVGGADLDDVMNVVLLAKSLDYVDLRNVFLYGESRGGMMTYQAIRDAIPVNAAAVFGAFTDLEIMNQSPRVRQLIPQIWPDYERQKESIIHRRSVKYWPEKLSVPILIMNGGADRQVDASQPLSLALQLQALKKEYALIIFAGGNHVLTADRLDRDDRAIRWFRRHMRN